MSGLRPIVNLDELSYTNELKHGERFDAMLAPIGHRIGAIKLGYNLTKVAPGKRAFPFHNHHVNEEMFFVLEGSGVLRLGAAEHPVRKGDFIACPPGGPQTAHQLVNTGGVDLLYLAVGTRSESDVFEYPDSGKFGASGGIDIRSGWPPKASFPARFMKSGQDADYWDGE
jgi:uncharacterized cupin superfamily protein